MNALTKFFAGILLVVALGFVGIHTNLLPWSAPKLQDKLAQRATAVLSSEETAWAQVTTDGQRVIVSGVAANQDAAETTIEKLKTAEGRGGLFWGGVTYVDASSVTIPQPPPLAAPFFWGATLQSDELALSGFTPSQSARDAIFQLAAMRFKDRDISGELEIASGAPPEDDWLNAVSVSLQALAMLNEGDVKIEDTAISIQGNVGDETNAARIRNLANSLPDRFTATSNIALSAPPPPVITRPEGPSLNEGVDAGASVEPSAATDESEQERLAAERNARLNARLNACRAELADTMSSVRIAFLSNSANLGQIDRRQLNGLAQALTGCPEFAITIIGHTDSSGNETRNRSLSLNRANAVRNYLASQGVEPNNVITEGAGSSRPLVSNRTSRGRAQNRRIEFVLNEQTPE